MLEVNLWCEANGLQVSVPEPATVPRVDEKLWWNGTAYVVRDVTYEFQERYTGDYGTGEQAVTVATLVIEPIDQ